MNTKSVILASLSVGMLGIQHANAQVQVTVDMRLVAQVISGSGSSRQVDDAGTTSFASGSRVRLTVQYRLTDETAGAYGTIYGTGGLSFSIGGVNTSGNGTITRSALTTDGTSSSNGEADAGNNSSGWASGPTYPQTGTSGTKTGLHEPLRWALNNNDSALSNGTISGGSIANVFAFNALGATVVNQLSGNWWGVYSFEFESDSDFEGTVDFNLSTTATTGPVFRGSSITTAPYTLLNASQIDYNLGGISLDFSAPAPLIIPAPGAAALLGLGGVLAVRRRRA